MQKNESRHRPYIFHKNDSKLLTDLNVKQIKTINLLEESESVSHSVVSKSLQPHGLQPARLLCPRNSPGKNTGVGCYALLQGIFPTQGSNLHLLSPALPGGFFTTSTGVTAAI